MGLHEVGGGKVEKLSPASWMALDGFSFLFYLPFSLGWSPCSVVPAPAPAGVGEDSPDH